MMPILNIKKSFQTDIEFFEAFADTNIMTPVLKIFLIPIAIIIHGGCSPDVAVTVRSQQPNWIPPPGTIEAPMTLKLAPGKFSGSASDIVVQGTISTTTTRPYALGSDYTVSFSQVRSYQDLNPSKDGESDPEQ